MGNRVSFCLFLGYIRFVIYWNVFIGSGFLNLGNLTPISAMLFFISIVMRGHFGSVENHFSKETAFKVLIGVLRARRGFQYRLC
jgi:hypothetical protein